MNKPKRKNFVATSILATFVLLACQQTIASEQTSISRDQAITIAKQHYPGRALKVSSTGSFFIVKLLTREGKIKQIRIDSKTGELK